MQGPFILHANSWNVRGRTLDKISLWMEGPGTEALGMLMLQEVAGLKEFKCKSSSCSNSLREFVASEDSELIEYRIFGTWEGDAHLSQVILLDESVVDSVLHTQAGGRCVEVAFRRSVLGGTVFLVGVRLPHKSTPEATFRHALVEVEGACLRAHSADMAIFAGDWNCEQRDARFSELTSVLHAQGFTLIYPEEDTWVTHVKEIRLLFPSCGASGQVATP